MSRPPNDQGPSYVTEWRLRLDEEIAFDEVQRAVLGRRLREDHSTILTDPITERMEELLRALAGTETENGANSRRADRQ